jgi:hypothetical protein
MSNDIHELHEVLFATLRGLKTGKLDIDRVKAINDTAQTIINAAKVEVDHIKLAGGASAFIAAGAAALPAPEFPQGVQPRLPAGAVKTQNGYKKTEVLDNGVVATVHRMV